MDFDGAQSSLADHLAKIGKRIDEVRKLAEDDPDVADGVAIDLIEIVDDVDERLGYASDRLDDMHSMYKGASESDPDAVYRLHEAICEGRKQDAIDILNSLFQDANLRSSDIQNFLFPERVQS